MGTVDETLQILNVCLREFERTFSDSRFGNGEVVGLAFFWIWSKNNWEGREVCLLKLLKVV
jgi:hypothetical protein